jgi:GNAT superfamily N-acetyltransferase
MERHISVDHQEPSQSAGFVKANIDFVIRAALRDPMDEDFVHSIAGRIIAETREIAEQEAGQLQAVLVQFDNALDHGIDTFRLGDGFSGTISEYWERLFDVETGYLKQDLQADYEVLSMDLLIIEHLELQPRFRGLGLGEAAINRTIDVFGPNCGFVACQTWPIQFTPAAKADPAVIERLALPKTKEGVALEKLRKYIARIGFWPLGDTGIYVLSMSQRTCKNRRQNKTH